MTKKNTNDEPSEEVEAVEVKERPKCFVIMPISDKAPYSAGHFRRVYKEIIIPAVEAAGYEPIRADDSNQSHLILLDILKSIVNYEMAICDLSGFNPNVLYELGIRQMARKPVVLIQDNDERLFDISGINALRYDNSLRVDLVREAVSKITDAINTTRSNYEKKAGSLLDLIGIDVQVKTTEVKVTEGESMILNEFLSLKSLLQKQSVIDSNILNKQIGETVYYDKYFQSLSRGDLVYATKESRWVTKENYYVINRLSGPHLTLWRLNDLSEITTPIESQNLNFEKISLSVDDAKKYFTEIELRNIEKLDSMYNFHLLLPF